MIVKILGMGCPKCNRLEQLAKEAAEEMGIEATFVKVKDMDEIINYGVSVTPALVINEEVKSAGRLPHKDEIKKWMQAA